jgi:glycerol-3-phosphate cytidylyltransferase
MVIGYTTGVFDMFHVGHLNILKKAKEQCDFLIVGVSTDELVLKEKNKLPIIPLKDRMEIVSAIKYVDQVVVQPDKDKMKAWERHHFDKMFVGSDWKGTPKWIEYEEAFKPLNVEIVYFSYTEGVSSTLLRTKI